jgi:hypothetical protein
MVLMAGGYQRCFFSMAGESEVVRESEALS